MYVVIAVGIGHNNLYGITVPVCRPKFKKQAARTLAPLHRLSTAWIRVRRTDKECPSFHTGHSVAKMAYDPSLYASTGSWAGMPYDHTTYGAPHYEPPVFSSRGYGGYGGGWHPSGPPRVVSMPYEGDPYRSYAPPAYGPYEDPYGYAPPPARPRGNKVYGVRARG